MCKTYRLSSRSIRAGAPSGRRIAFDRSAEASIVNLMLLAGETHTNEYAPPRRACAIWSGNGPSSDMTRYEIAGVCILGFVVGLVALP